MSRSSTPETRSTLCRVCVEPIYPRRVRGRWIVFDAAGNEHDHDKIASAGDAASSARGARTGPGPTDDGAPAPGGDSRR